MIEVGNFYQFDIVRNVVAKLRISANSFSGVQFESDGNQLYFKAIYTKTPKGLRRVVIDSTSITYEVINRDGWSRTSDLGIESQYTTVRNRPYCIKKVEVSTGKVLNKYYNVQDANVVEKCRKLIPVTELERFEMFIKLSGTQKYFYIKHNGKFGYWIDSQLYYKEGVK